MEKTIKLLVFEIQNQLFALNIHCVERIVQIVEINSLPQMPDFISGVINMHGEIIPVINMDILFNSSKKKLELSDQLIIVKSTSMQYALWVDKTTEVIEVEKEDVVGASDFIDQVPYLKAVAKENGNLIYISDVDKFLNTEELFLLNEALKNRKDLVCVNL